MSPLISVILPVYNGEIYLAQAIESILSQTMGDFELLIIDNASTDSSPEIIKRFEAADDRIRYIKQQTNMGLVSSLNRGIENATAELIARMDADDIASPNRFKLQTNYLKKNPDVAILGGSINIITKDGSFIRKATYPQSMKSISKFIKLGCPLAHPTVMMRKSAVNEAGGYNELFTNAEDYDLWLRLFDLGYKIENLSEVILQYRQHETKMSTVHRSGQATATIIARMCHETRTLGLKNPLEDQTEITEKTANLFPKEISNNFEFELFEALYGNVSLLTTKEIKNTIAKANELPKLYKSSPEITRFYLRCARGFFGNKNYLSTVALVLKAFISNPSTALNFIKSKIS